MPASVPRVLRDGGDPSTFRHLVIPISQCDHRGVRRPLRHYLLAMNGSPVSLTSRTLLILGTVTALALATAACSPADSKPAAATGTGTGTGTADGAADCSPATLNLVTKGTLTVATDTPAYAPWFDNNTPSDGKGFESAVAYAVAAKLGFTQSQVKWVTEPFDNSYAPGPKNFDFDLNQISITDERKKSVDRFLIPI